jgi:DNA sulfur modification protein DndB
LAFLAGSLGDVDLTERAKTTMGVLELSGNEEAFPIDGQHRVEAIKKALEQDNRIAGDEQCIIFVAHRTDKAGHERTRRLFSTLNRYARPVSKGEIIALDQDDTFAIVTRKLIEEYRYLRMRKFTVFTTTPNLPSNDERSITTVLALYDLVKILAAPKTPAGNSQRKDLIIGPPQQNKITSIYKQHVSFWEALRQHVSAIRLVTNSRRKAGSFRRENGGHILFRPVGQMAFANAARILMDRGKILEEAVKVLSHVPLELNSHPWRFVLWNPEQGTVIIKNSTLALNLLLYMAGEEPSSKKYDLEERYQKVLGDSNSGLRASKLLSTLVV